MKHINHFNQFIIKESLAIKEDIKEILEDYLLDYIDESLVSSTIRLDGYVPEDEIELVGNSPFLISSSISKGSMPIYTYELDLNKRYAATSIQNSINRLKGDKDFKISSYHSTSSETLISNGDIEESTTINISFVYMLNPKADTPKEVKEISEPLKKLGYLMAVNEYGKSYYWNKSIVKKVEIPLEWFSINKQNGVYKALNSKYSLVQDRVRKSLISDIEKTFEELKSIIPSLPDLTRDERDERYYYLKSKSDKLSVHIYCRLERTNRDSDLMNLELEIQVNYSDKNI